MNEQAIEELLGAYALDAVDESERAEIEAHLEICPRCRAEVSAHREVAALLAHGGAVAPEGIWGAIAREIAPELPDLSRHSEGLIAALPGRPRSANRRPRTLVGSVLGIAAAVAAIALLSVQVANLSGQVHSERTSAVGMSAAVNSILAHPHRSVILTSSVHDLGATVVIGADGNAYWIDSNLATLPHSKTYQLWALVRGSTVVSLGVIGANPKNPSAFRIESDMSKLMVTIEPEGGTPTPTTPVLMSAALSI